MAVQPKYLGARVQRVEDGRLITGRGQYLADIRLPDMLHLAFVRSPIAHARIRSIDTAQARALPGVAAVISGADLRSVLKPIVANNRAPGFKHSEWPIIAHDIVRYVGEAVAVVVADSRYTAEDAVELVQVDYERLPVVSEPVAALRADSPWIRPEWGDNVYFRHEGSFGDVGGAFQAAHFILKGTYRTQRQAGIPMEPRGCLAQLDQRTQALTLWTSTQVPHLVRTAVADSLGFPENRLRVIAPDVGGGFGIKSLVYPEEILVAHLAVRLNRAVKWISDRREDLLTSVHAREHIHEVEAAVDANGIILGLKARIIVDSGAYSTWPWTASMEAGMASNNLPGPYQIRNYQFEALTVATNKTPLGPYRGVARPSVCFTIERVVDEIAHELGLDPAEVRLRNLIASYPYTTVTGLYVDSGSLVESLHKALKMLDYEGLRQQQREARASGRYVGIGLANYTEQTAHAQTEFAKRGLPVTLGFDSATVRMDPSGKAVISVGIASHGQGLETTLAQVAADELGIPIEDIRVIHGDTDLCAYGMGTFGSRSAVIGGGVVSMAAKEVHDKMRTIASRLLEVAEEDLQPVNGRFEVTGAPNRSISVAEVARAAYHRAELIGDLSPGLESTRFFNNPPGTGTFSNAVHAAVVEVDVRTGHVEILRYLVVDDCGVVINPTIVAGQVHGGVAQGLGSALYEHLIHDENGQLLTTTFMDYLLPGFTEVPNIELGHLVTPSPFTPKGMKGVGEGGAIAPGPAIANAVCDALSAMGVNITELPVTPERVLRAIQDAQRGGRP